MLVDKMEYQGQQGGGGAQDDAFYELLSSTAMANAKKQQQQQQQQHHSQHQQFEQQAFDSRSEESILPSYDFQQNSSPYGGGVSNGDDKVPGMAPVASSYPSGGPPFQVLRQHPPIPSFVEAPPARQERGNNNTEAASVAAVEQTMMKYMDDLMHLMESLTGRIGQLESSTHRLEQMVTDFKGGSDKNHGATGSKLLHIETMLSEVQRGVQDLRDKQGVVETQSNMRKFVLGEENISLSSSGHNQTSLEPPPPQSPRAPQMPETQSYPPHHPHHPHHPPPPPYMVPPQLVGLAPPPPPAPAVHPESHYPSSQQGGPPPQQFYSQQQQQQQQGPPPPSPQSAHSHGPPPFSHQPELPSYGAPPQGPYKGQSVPFGQEVPPLYGNRPQQGPSSGSGGPPMYDQSGLLPPYQSQGRPAAPVYEQRQEQQMSGPPQGYANVGYRAGQQAPSAPSSGAGGYPRLPTALPVPHAMPTGREREGAAAASSGATPLSTNRLSIDDVIDKVAVMGFSKDQVRAVVRRLTENGQSVDLNIVLDKLMNGEAGQQQGKGWFQRG